MIRSNCNFISVIIQAAVLSYTALLITTAQAQQDTAIVRTYGGPYFEEGREIIECAAGGYAIIGTTGSDQLNNTNIYLLRLDENLDCVWNRNYGGADVEWGYSLVENAQGQLLLCGYTNSQGHGGYDILIIKLDEDGNVIWQKTYGGTDWDFGYKIIAHPTEGYLICGKTYSYGNGGSDGYLLHINEDGNVINEWTFGGEGDDELRDIVVHGSESIIICGTEVNDGISISTIWSINLSSGAITWQTTIPDDTTNSYSTAITKHNDRIFFCGVKQLESGDYGYICEINSDGDLLEYTLNIPGSFESSIYLDLAVTEDYIYVVGKNYVAGYDSFAGVLYRLNHNGYFIQGFVYGDNAEGDFTSIVMSNDAPCFVGKHAYFDTGNTQVISMKYDRENLYNGDMVLVNSTCFTVGIESFEKPTDLAPPFSIYNLLGQIVIENIDKDLSEIMAKIEPGFYLIKSQNDAVVKKIYKNQ